MKIVSKLGLATVLLLTAAVGRAQEPDAVVQTLDSVSVHSRTNVISMNFDDPARTADFENFGIAGADLIACRLTATRGLFCLDGEQVRRWSDPANAATDELAVDCNDPGLGLDARKARTCSGIAVGLDGTIWLAGVGARNKYSLVRVTDRPAAGCPAGATALTLTEKCAQVTVRDRSLLTDISVVDGDVAAAYGGGAGVLALEDGKAAVFFPNAGGAVEIVSGKQAWQLSGNEGLQSLAFFQLGSGAAANNYVLATTTSGRVLAAVANADSTAAPAFDIAANRENGSVQCDFRDPRYGIRASSKSGVVYVTDREYCQVVALRPAAAVSPLLLVNETELVIDPSGTPIGTRDLTLSTAAGPAATFPPFAPTIAPGIAVDLDDCAGECVVLVDEIGNPAFSMNSVQLASVESGLSLFQIRNIPDCRYIPLVCEELLGVADLVAAGVVIDSGATGDPAAQLLNVTALLPAEITALFDASGTPPGGLPPLLMSRHYRGQAQNGFRFEALFGVVEEGTVFTGVFESEFDVAALSGSELGCVLGLPAETPAETLLNWDTVTTASETWVGIDGQYRDTLINADCGSSKGAGTRWSIVSYNTELTPCSRPDDALDNYSADGNCAVGAPEVVDDAVFFKLMLELFDDFLKATNQLACTDVDGGGSAPLSGSTCATIVSGWDNAKDKLDKCWDAAQTPKQSSGSQNCQSFETQFSGLKSTVETAPAFGPDPANRRGELIARLLVLEHLYNERVVPSIPAAGFSEP